MSRRPALLAAVAALVIPGLALALAAHREAARRSLVPLELDAILVSRRVRLEKHPGSDDRFYLVLRDERGERTVEIEPRVFGLLADGQHLRKARGESVLHAPGRDIPLRREGDGDVLAVVLAAGLLPLLGHALTAPARD